MSKKNLFTLLFVAFCVGLGSVGVFFSRAQQQYVSDKDNNAYTEGVTAYKQGLPVDACPYADGSQHEKWKRGWADTFLSK